MVTVLMMSAKMATPSLLKIRVFWNKGYDVISSAHDVTNRFLSHHSSCIIDVVMWLKFGNLSIRQKSREPSFWEVMDSRFISICKFGGFKNAFATITSLSELYFRIKIYPFGTNEKSDFYELWQQHKQLIAMKMNEAWRNIFYVVYIRQFQP